MDAADLLLKEMDERLRCDAVTRGMVENLVSAYATSQVALGIPRPVGGEERFEQMVWMAMSFAYIKGRSASTRERLAR
jgi:hypothetical protein